MGRQSGVEARALNLMQEALELLDNSQVPGHIGAHLDLAITQLEGLIVLLESTPASDTTSAKPHKVGLRSVG